MRPLVQADDLHLSYGPNHVLRGASFVIHPGDKIALVGPNGAGKSTIFKLLTGAIEPDLGTIESQDLRLAYLPQVPDIPPATPVMELLAAPTKRAERLGAEVRALEAWMAEPDAWDQPDANEKMQQYAELQERLAEERSKGTATRSPLLNDLGVPEELLESDFGSLSGGERSKVLLCKALSAAKDADLLLLDEPTNHMDIPTVEFIEQYLMDLKGSVLLSSHDKYLLDNVADRVFEVDRQRVDQYTGNYSSYRAQRTALQRAVAAKKKRQFDEVKRQLAIIEDLKGRKRYTQVAGRRKMVGRIQEERIEEAPTSSKGFRLLFGTDRPPRDALVVEGVAKSFGDRTLFSHVDLEVEGGDKIGVVGPNGCGKSTLLKVLTGRVEPDAGTVRAAPGVRFGYFDQHHETLQGDRTLIEEARSLRDPPPPDEWTRGLLGRFQFTGDAVFKRVSELSGGERARLALAKFIVDQHNTLVLDEPTNHLDLASQEIVAGALREYEGTVIVVSHDRSFLDQVCDKTLVIARRQVALFPGGFSDASSTDRMARFVGAGIQGRFRVRKAFRDWERDHKYLQGDVIEVNGMESQAFRRLLRWAENEGRIEAV